MLQLPPAAATTVAVPPATALIVAALVRCLRILSDTLHRNFVFSPLCSNSITGFRGSDLLSRSFLRSSRVSVLSYQPITLGDRDRFMFPFPRLFCAFGSVCLEIGKPGGEGLLLLRVTTVLDGTAAGLTLDAVFFGRTDAVAVFALEVASVVATELDESSSDFSFDVLELDSLFLFFRSLSSFFHSSPHEYNASPNAPAFLNPCATGLSVRVKRSTIVFLCGREHELERELESWELDRFRLPAGR